MTIGAIINAGLTSLVANQTALRTTSVNVANVNTPGYVRRLTNFETKFAGETISGVEISSVTRAVSDFLETERLNAAADDGRAAAADKLLDQLQKSMGGVADGRDPSSRLAALTAGLAHLSTDPSSLVSKNEFVQHLREFAQTVSTLAGKIQDLRTQADNDIGLAVTRVNELSQRITDLNEPIQKATLAGDEASPLRDERDSAVRELASLLDIQVEQGVAGRISVSTKSGYTLVSDSASTATHLDTGIAAPGTVFPDLTVKRINPLTGAQIGTTQTFEQHITGGKLRGLLDMRDNKLPQIAEQLGALSAGTAEALNGASNNSSTWPAPSSLTGRNSGLLSTDALNFTGKSSVAIVDSLGKLVRRVDVDFGAGTLSVDGGAASSITGTIGGFATALNSALSGVGSASFTNGVMTLSASGTNGVAVQQDATTPSDRAGRGFSQTFGLNDMLTARVSTNFATGLTSADAHGFAGGSQITFGLRNSASTVVRHFTYTVAGSTIADMVSGLNGAAGSAGTFTLNSDGSIAFTAAGGSTQRLEIEADNTARGGTGTSLTSLFGIGPRYRMEQATTLSVNASLTATPSRLPSGQLRLTGTSAPGDLVLASGDNGGILAMQRAAGQASFEAVGSTPARSTSLSDYAANLVASIGQEAATASRVSLDAAASKKGVEDRAVSHDGVSLDEELANMIKYQQAYNAGARLITTAQRLYDELLSIMK